MLRADLTRRTLRMGAATRGSGGSSGSGRKEVAEGDFWRGRGGDGDGDDGARLLGTVPPETLREEREEESGCWRLKGDCALTLTIFL